MKDSQFQRVFVLLRGGDTRENVNDAVPIKASAISLALMSISFRFANA